jgi:hypothetical protein
MTGIGVAGLETAKAASTLSLVPTSSRSLTMKRTKVTLQIDTSVSVMVLLHLGVAFPDVDLAAVPVRLLTRLFFN